MVNNRCLHMHTYLISLKATAAIEKYIELR